jgi:HAD superfamily hydrolase (TIGR01509 family)
VSARAGGERWLVHLRAVTFDFGNTLVPIGHDDLARVVASTVDRVLGAAAAAERDGFLAAWAEERERQFAEDVPALREVDIGQRFVRVFARMRGMAAPPREERWDDRIAATYSSAGEVSAAIDHYVDAFVASIPVPPGVGPLLASIAVRRTVGILSNWPVALAIERYVEAAGWSSHLAAVVVSQRVGAIKPTERIFRAAEAALGVPAGSILHVGDDWAADVVGAKRAGWRAAYLRDRQAGSPLPSSRPDGSVDADLVVGSLDELAASLVA